MKRLELLGGGATGKVYKMCPSEGGDDEDLFEGVKSIDLYLSPEGGSVNSNPILKLNKPDALRSLSKGLCARIDYAWKVFESSAEFTDINMFKDELKITNKVNNIYGENSKNFINTAPIELDAGFDAVLKINGMVINFLDNKKPKYVLFVKAGNNKYWKDDIDIVKFCEDILESLVILNAKGYRHGDIKWENVIKCGDKYTLIDWGFCHKLDEIIKYGDVGSINPVKLNILNNPFMTAAHFFEQEEMGLYLPPEEYHGYGPIPGEIYRRRKIIGLEPIDDEVKIIERRLAAGEFKGLVAADIEDKLKYYKTNENAKMPELDCVDDSVLPEDGGRLCRTTAAKVRRNLIETALTPGLYLETLRRKKKEYRQETRVIISTDSLKKKFKETFDVHMLGMTVLSLVVPGRTLLDIGGHESQRGYDSIVKVPSGAVQSRPAIMEDMRNATLDEQPLISKEIVRKFTSLSKPLNPQQALDFIRSISPTTPRIARFNPTDTPRPKAPVATKGGPEAIKREEARRALALQTQKEAEKAEIKVLKEKLTQKTPSRRRGGARNRKTRKRIL